MARTETSKEVTKDWHDTKEHWYKDHPDSCTDADKMTIEHKDSGNITDRYGNIVGNTKDK